MDSATNIETTFDRAEAYYDGSKRGNRKFVVQTMGIGSIIIFYITFSRMATLSTENLNLEKACSVNIGFNESVCEAMVVRNQSGYTEDQEIEVQRLVTSMVAYKSVILGIIPFVLLLFLGSWSDRHKMRKPFILMPIYGEIISSLGCLLCSIFFNELPLEVAIFFESVPLALTGYLYFFFIGIFSFVTENTSLEKRTSRLGIATLCKAISLTLGIALSGLSYQFIGFKGVYSLSILMFVVSILDGSFILKKESYKGTPNSKNILKDIFDYHHVSSTFAILSRKKRQKKSFALILIIIIAMLRMGSYRGELSMMYMFTRRKFTWNELDFSVYNTYQFITNQVGSLITIAVFANWMEIDDAVLGMITMLTQMIGCVCQGLAPSPLYYYIGSTLRMTSGTTHMILRFVISEVVCPEELTQVYSIVAAFEALSHFVFGVFYSLLYHSTIENQPGAFYILSATLHGLSFIAFFWLYRLKTGQLDREINDEKKDEVFTEKDITFEDVSL